MGMIYAPPSIIPNGALINGVCHIYQSTKPTTRPDGSVLVVGDIWYNISTGVTGFWNGTYWLNTILEVITRWRNITNTNSLVFPVTTELDGDRTKSNVSYFLESVSYSISLLSSGDTNNYRFLQIQRRGVSGNADFTTLGYASSTRLFSSSNRNQVLNEPINRASIPYNTTNTEWLGFTFNFFPIGTAPNGSNPSASLYLREIL